MNNNNSSSKSKRKKLAHLQQQDVYVKIPGITSISDLPTRVLSDILSRLSINLVYRCKSVCKPWLNLIVDPTFAKLHSSKSAGCFLLRESNEDRMCKILYLVDFERDNHTSVVYDYSCNVKSCDSDRLCNRHVDMKLDTAFMLPERETDSMYVRKRRFRVVNSCNGLLCLRGSVDAHPLVIYNPVTSEYLILPVPDPLIFPKYDGEDLWRKEQETKPIVCGLGFCPKTKQYKVLVVITEQNMQPEKKGHDRCRVALLYTLGLGPWRRIGRAPYFEVKKKGPTFLNGALHWYVSEEVILSFDFESEKFRALPTQIASFEDDDELQKELVYDEYKEEGFGYFFNTWKLKLGVLGGCLCLCGTSDLFPIYLWVMEKYGVKESWKHVYENNPPMFTAGRWPRASYVPIGYLNNGDLLVHCPGKALISYNGRKFKYFKIHEHQSKAGTSYHAIPHFPSFVSLKGVVGDSMNVLYVKSRLGTSGAEKLKKAERISLVEEVPYTIRYPSW